MSAFQPSYRHEMKGVSLLKWLSELLKDEDEPEPSDSQEFSSTEIEELEIIDSLGNSQVLGSSRSEVSVDKDGNPVVKKTKTAFVLDCSHVVSSPAEVFAKCSNDHTICRNCQIYTCAKEGCDKRICDLCSTENDDGEKQCKEHAPSALKVVLWILALMILSLVCEGRN